MATVKKKIFSLLPILSVIILTLLLLTYVGYGEAGRIYPNFQIDKMITQTKIMEYPISSFLQAGFSLKQYSGFKSISNELLESDATIENIRILTANSQDFFVTFQKDIVPSEIESRIQSRTYTNRTIKENSAKEIQVQESNDSYRVVMKLEGKFGVEGYLILESLKKTLLRYMNIKYRLVYFSLIILIGILILFIFLYEVLTRNKQKKNALVYIISNLVCFIVMSIVISIAVFQIYGEGARANTQALAQFMSQRLGGVLELGLNFSDISDMNETLNEYKQSNPNINSISLTEGNVYIYSTDPKSIGKPYTVLPENYEYVIPLGGPPNSEISSKTFRISVSIPVNIVKQAILASAKNFIVLFIACILISMIFLEVSSRLLVNTSEDSEDDIPEDIESRRNLRFQWKLSLIKPAYFIIVFVSALSVSFLPKLVETMLQANKAGSGGGSTFLPFSIYYLFFAMVLIPAGIYSERSRHGGVLKILMGIGFVAESGGLLLITLMNSFWGLTLGRALSGIGQGVFLIGLQSYLIAVTPSDKRTQGAAVKVIARNSALIAGSAIGALLYVYMSYRALFLLSSILSLVGLTYLVMFVPTTKKHSHGNDKKGKTNLINTFVVLKDPEFLRSWLLIGLVGKISITGIIMFSIPLVMNLLGFPTEDIGQALMLYYIGSMVTTGYIAKLVDKKSTTWGVLFFSALISGVAMIILGSFGTTDAETSKLPGFAFFQFNAIEFQALLDSSKLANIVFILCILLTGISNGLLTAPIITHITKTRSAKKYGEKSVTATYIFLERIGHVLGPAVASLFFFMSSGSNLAITYFGIFTVLVGTAFVITTKKKTV